MKDILSVHSADDVMWIEDKLSGIVFHFFLAQQNHELVDLSLD